MKYYKITMSDKVYVARGHCISMVADEFHNEFGFDNADNPIDTNEFICFEPLTENIFVNGVDSVDALDTAFETFRRGVEEVRIDSIKEYGLEEAEAIMDEEYGYPDLEETTMILEVDNVEQFDIPII